MRQVRPRKGVMAIVVSVYLRDAPMFGLSCANSTQCLMRIVRIAQFECSHWHVRMVHISHGIYMSALSEKADCYFRLQSRLAQAGNVGRTLRKCAYYEKSPDTHVPGEFLKHNTYVFEKNYL